MIRDLALYLTVRELQRIDALSRDPEQADVERQLLEARLRPVDGPIRDRELVRTFFSLTPDDQASAGTPALLWMLERLSASGGATGDIETDNLVDLYLSSSHPVVRYLLIGALLQTRDPSEEFLQVWKRLEKSVVDDKPSGPWSALASTLVDALIDIRSREARSALGRIVKAAVHSRRRGLGRAVTARVEGRAARFGGAEADALRRALEPPHEWRL